MKSDRERQIPHGIMYMCNLKYDTSELITKQKQTFRHREQTVVNKGEEDGEGMEWDFGISRCKLVYTEWMKNKVVLQSTGNSIQYLEINHNKK